MKYSKLETLERKKAALAAELAAIDQNLEAMSDEAAAAAAKLAKINAGICGAVLYRLMKKRHEANPAKAEAELAELADVLVIARERKAFGLPPLPLGGREHGARDTQ